MQRSSYKSITPPPTTTKISRNAMSLPLLELILIYFDNLLVLDDFFELLVLAFLFLSLKSYLNLTTKHKSYQVFLSIIVDIKRASRGGGHRWRLILWLKTCLSQGYTLQPTRAKHHRLRKSIRTCVIPPKQDILGTRFEPGSSTSKLI